MTINSNYEFFIPDDFDTDKSINEYDDSMGDFDLNTTSTQNKNSKRNYQAKKEIERRKEERRLKKLLKDDYDDWE